MSPPRDSQRERRVMWLPKCRKWSKCEKRISIPSDISAHLQQRNENLNSRELAESMYDTFCAEITNGPKRDNWFSGIYLGEWERRLSRLPFDRQALRLCLHHQFQHCIPLHYVAVATGDQRHARGCNSPQGAINAMQRGWLANSATSRPRREEGGGLHSFADGDEGDRFTLRLYCVLRQTAISPTALPFCTSILSQK